MNKVQHSGLRMAASGAMRELVMQPAGQLALSLLLAAALHAAVILGFELAWRQGAPQPAPAVQAFLHFSPAAQAPVSATPAMRPEDAPAPAERFALQEGAPRAAVPHSLSSNSEVARQSSAKEAVKPRASFDLPYDALIRQIAIAQRDAHQSQSGAAALSRTKRLASPSAASLAEAAYLNAWRQKVERIGRANHPGGMGQLRLQVLIRQDGALLEARILQSSGHPALDEAALRILRLAAPYAQFPVEMRKAYDQLEITRSWQFSRAALLSSRP